MTEQAGDTKQGLLWKQEHQYIPAGTDVPAEVIHRLEQDEIWRQWGWSSINSVQPEPFPPAELLIARATPGEAASQITHRIK